MRNIYAFILACMFLGMTAFELSAQGVWDGGGDGSSWNDPVNWDNNAVPTATDAVTIDTDANVTLAGTNGVCLSLTIGGSGVGDTLIVSTGVNLDVGGNVGIMATNDILTLSGSASLNLEGDWTNAGVFNENNSLVIFDGTILQTISNNTVAATETFFNLTVDNTGGGANLGLENEVGGAGTRVIVSGNLTISDGEYNVRAVTSGSGSDLRIVGDLTIANVQGGEGFDFSAANVVVEIGGDLNDNEPGGNGLQDGGSSTLIFNGTGDQSFNKPNGGTERVHDIEVNKPSGTFTFDNSLTLRGDLRIVNGAVEVAAGMSLAVGEVPTAAGDSLTVASGATFTLNNSSTLQMWGGSNVFVASGGTFASLGSSGANVTVTSRDSIAFTFDVAGTMRARYTDFSFLDNAGVDLNNGATLHATDNFDFCVFSDPANGTASPRYITMDDLTGVQQAFQVDSVQFVDIVTGTGTPSNVAVLGGDDTLNIVGASGAFAGESFDLDPGSQINWTGTSLTLTWNGGFNTTWDNALNWTPNAAPTSADIVTVPDIGAAAPYPALSGGINRSVLSLTIESGPNNPSVTVGTTDILNVSGGLTVDGTLTLTGSAQLRVGGDYDNTNGTLNANTSTVTFNGVGAQSITTGGTGATKQFNNVVVDKTSGTATLAGAIDVNGDFSIAQGTFDVSASDFAVTVANSWSNSGTFTPQNGTVTFDGSGTITTGGTGAGKTFNGLVFGGTTHTLAGALKVNGDLSILSGATLDVSGSNHGVNAAGGWDNDGTFTPQNGTVTFDGSVDQFVDFQPNDFWNLTINKSAGTLTDTNAVAPLLDVNGDFNLTNGGFDLTGNMDVEGSVSIGSGGVFDLNDGTVNVAEGWSNASSILNGVAASTLVFDGTAGGPFNINEANTINDITFDGSITYTIASGMDINGHVTLNSGTVDGNGQSINAARNWTNNGGTFNANFSTVTFDNNNNGPDTLTSGGSAFYDLIINRNGGGVGQLTSDDFYAADPVDADNDFTLQDGQFILLEFAVGMNVGGNFTIGAAGNLDADTTQPIVLDAQLAGTYSIDDGNGGAIDFELLTINAVAGAQYDLVNAFDFETDIDRDLKILSGKLSLNGQTLTFGRTGLVPTEDSILVTGSGELEINQGAVLKMNAPQTNGTGNDIVVGSGGLLKIIGAQGNEAVITREGEGQSTVRKWRLKVESGGAIQANNAIFRHMDSSGVVLESGAILHPTNNFSNTQFDAIGALDGNYLVIGDIFGSGQTFEVNNIGFLNQPAGTGGSNIKRFGGGTDTLLVTNAFGVFAGEDFDLELQGENPGIGDSGLVIWRNASVARQWTGANGTAWDDTLNWAGNVVPDSTENAFVPDLGGAANYPTVTGTQFCNNLNLENNAVVTITGGDTLFVYGGMTFGTSGNQGDLILNANAFLFVAGGWDNQFGDFFASSPSTVVFFGSADQTFHAGSQADDKDFDNLTINKTGGTVAQVSAIDIDGIFTLASGTYDISTSIGFNMDIAGGWVNTGGTFVTGVQTVIFDGTSGNINGGTGGGKAFYNIQINNEFGTGSHYTLTGDLDVDNAMTFGVAAGGSNDTLDAGADFSVFLGTGLDFNGGEFLPRNGTFTFDGTVGQNIASDPGITDTVTFYNVTIVKGGGAVALDNGVLNADNVTFLDIDGDLNIVAGTLDLNGDTLDLEGDLTISGILTPDATGVLFVAGNWDNSGTFNASTSNVTLDGVNQSLKGNFSTLNLGGGGGTKTATDVLDLSGSLTIDPVVEFDGGGLSHTIAGNWTNNGTYTPGGGAITFDAGITSTVTTGGSGAGKQFFDFTVSKTSGNDLNNDVKLVGDLKVNNDLTVTDGELRAELNNVNVNVGGNWTTVSTGDSSFIQGTGILTFDGTSGGPYAIDNGNDELNAVTIDAASVTYNLGATTTILDDLNVTAGTLSLNGQLLDFGDDNLDSIIVEGTFDVDAGSILEMFAQNASGAGSDLVVLSGGTVVVVGAPGNNATVTRFSGTGAGDAYSFAVNSGGSIQARNATFEFMDLTGIQLLDGSSLNLINNFGSVTFNNGTAGGTYLNVGDISGANQNITINATQFLSDPGGGAFNVTKSATTDTLTFNLASGGFAGEAFDSDPGNVVIWTNDAVTRTWTGSVGNDWTNAGNWSVAIPATNENALIPSAGVSNFPIIDGTIQANDVTVLSGASITIGSAGDPDTLDLSGSLTINSSATLTMVDSSVLSLEGNYVNAGIIVEATSQIIFDGSADQALNTGGQAGSQELFNLTVNKPVGTVTLANPVEVNGNLTIVDGALDVSEDDHLIRLAGDWSNSGAFAPRNGQVLFDGSGLIAGGAGSNKAFFNVRIFLTANRTMAGDVDIDGRLDLDNTGILDASASNYTLSVGEVWDNDGTGGGGFVPMQGTVIFDGNAAQTLDLLFSTSDVDSFFNVIINNTGGTVALGGTGGVDVDLKIKNDLTITQGTFSLGTNAMNVEGDVGISGTLTTGANTINVAGNWINNGSFTGSNTLILDGTTQSFSGLFNNVTLANSGTKTAADTLDIAGNLTIDVGAEFDAATYTHFIAGDFDASGNFLGGTSTLNFDGAGSQSLITGGTGATKFFNNVVINSGGTVTLEPGNDLDVDGDLTVSAGTFSADANTIFLGGNWSNAGTVNWTSDVGQLYLDATSGSRTIEDGSSPFERVTVDASSVTYSLTGTTEINGDLTIANGTFSLNGKALQFGNAITDSILVFDVLDVDELATLKMFVSANSGSDLAVFSGGVVQVVGIAGSEARVTRFTGIGANDRYSFTVGSGATIQARFGILEYMNSGGIVLQDGAIVHPINNFSDCQFDNGASAGTMLNVNNINGANQSIDITDVGFPNNPGGGASNVTKSVSSDTLRFDMAFGVFAGESFDNDIADIPGVDSGRVVWTNTVVARQWTGDSNRVWNIAANWLSNQVPSASEDALIPDVTAGSGNNPIVSGTQSIRNVIIRANGFLTIAAGDTLDMGGSLAVETNGIWEMKSTAVLSVEGDLVNNGDVTQTSSSLIVLDGTANQTFNAGGDGAGKALPSVTVNKATGTVILGSDVDIDNAFTFTSGTFDVSTDNNAMTVGGNWTNGGTFVPRLGTVTLDGTATLNSGGTGAGKQFYNLTINGNIAMNPTANSTKSGLEGVSPFSLEGKSILFRGVGSTTMANDLDVSNTLTIEAGALLDVSGIDYSINVGGDWLNDGSFDAQNGTVTIDGSGDQNIDPSATLGNFYDLIVDKSGGTASLTSQTLNVTNNLTLSNGTLSTGSFNVDVDGDLTIQASASLVTGSNAIRVFGDWNNLGAFSGSSTVRLDGVNQNLNGDFTRIIFEGSGTKSATGPLDIADDLIIESGTTFNAVFSHMIGDDWTNSGTVNATGTTITFDGLGTQTITSGGAGPSKAFNNITINKSSGTVILAASNALELDGNLTITNGTLNANNNNINVAGSFLNSGSFTAGTGTLLFDGTTGGPFSIDAGGSAFNALTVNAPGRIYNLTGAADINQNLTITAGTFSLNGKTLDFGDSNTDSIKVFGTFEADTGSTLRMYTSGTSGSDVVVNSGGIVRIVGISGNKATVTRFNGIGASSRYSFLVNSGGRMQARFALFEYMDINGIQLATGAILNATNNFSDCEFDNGPSGGTYLNIFDLSGTASYAIDNAGFLSDPGGSAFNVTNTTDSLLFDAAFGVFAGESFDSDPNDNPGIDSGLVVWTNTVTGVVWTGNVSTAWDLAGNWLSGVVPTSADDAFIPDVSGASGRFPVVTGTESIRSVTIQSGARLTVQTTDTLEVLGSITVTGDLIMNGTAFIRIAGAYNNTNGNLLPNLGTIVMNGSAGQEIRTGGTATGKELYNLVIDKTSGAATLFADMTVQNDLTITQGTLDVGSDFDITVGGNWDNSGTFVPANGTVNLTHTGASVTVTGGNFYNLVLASGSLAIPGGDEDKQGSKLENSSSDKKETAVGTREESGDGVEVLSGGVILGSALDVNKNLNIQIGTELDVSAGSNFGITIGGDWDNDGTFIGRKGTVTLDGSGAQSVDAAATVGTFWNLAVNKPGGSATLTSNIDVDSAFSVNNGTFSSGTFAVDIEGPTTIAGTWTTGITTSITAAGDWNNSGTFSGSNTVTLDGTGQSLNGAFNSLVLSGGGAKTATAALNIAANLTIGGGVTFSTGAFSHTLGGNWTNTAGTFTAGSGTVTLNGSGTQTLTSGGSGATKAFNNVIVAKSGGAVNLAASNTLEVNGNLIITSGTLNANTNDILVGGSFTNSALFTPGTGTLTFDAASGGPYTIDDGSSSLGAVTINAAASNILYQLIGTTDVNGNLSVLSGTFDFNGNTLTFGDGNTDSIKISDTLIIDEGAELDMYTTGTAGSDVVVRNGGTIRIVGMSGNTATVTRFNGATSGARYSFKVESGGTVEANFADLEFMDANGINLLDGATLHPTNNFSNTDFSNGASGGTYLNVGDLTGANQTFTILFAGFLTNPGGGASNVAVTNDFDSLFFDFATGAFAGELFDSDPNNVVNWANVTVVHVWTGNTSNSWAINTNWSTNLVPTASEDAQIPDVSGASGRFPRVPGIQVVRNLTIDPGANLRLNNNAILDMGGTINIDGELRLNNNSTLRLEGDFVNNGILNLPAGTVSTVQLDGLVGQTITTGGTGVGKPFVNLTILKPSGTASLDGNIALNRGFSLTTGTFNVTTSNYSMNVGSNWSSPGTFIAQNGTVVFDGASAQGLNSGSNAFYNLDVSASGTVTLNTSNLDVDNDLTITSGTLSAAVLDINVGGDWLNSGTFTAGTGTVTLDATAGPGSLDAGGSSFNNLSVNAAGVTYNVISALDVSGDLRVNNGTLALGSNTLTFGDADGDSILVAGTLSVGANGAIQMFDQTELNVSSGGTFTALGSDDLNRASMTRLGGSGNYRIIVESGGTINPRFATFQYTGETGLPGIDVQAGATINATNKFDNCNFNNGIGTAYLSIGNAQSLTINDVRIDSAAAARATDNVDYTGTGSLVFNDYKGTMSGARFENDDTTGIGYKGRVRWIFDEIQPIASTGTFVFGNDLVVEITTLNGLSLIQVALTDTIQTNVTTNFAVRRFYTIDATPKAGNATLNMTQYYVDEELNNQVEASLDMWRYHPSSFFDGPILATARDGVQNFVRVNALSSDTLAATTAADWFLSTANVDVELPVELAYFEAVSIRGKNQLDWKTESEVNNSHWMIERQELELINKAGGDLSEDYTAKTDYTAMVYVQGQGTKSSETDYTWSDLDVEIGKFYRYRLADVNFSGAVYYHEPLIIEVTGPKKFAMHQNYPNPFNPTTKIRYELPLSSDVSLKIYNILGQEVATLINRTQKAGFYELQWNGQNKNGLRVSSGVYIYRIVARGENGRHFVQTRKMMVVK